MRIEKKLMVINFEFLNKNCTKFVEYSSILEEVIMGWVTRPDSKARSKNERVWVKM